MKWPPRKKPIRLLNSITIRRSTAVVWSSTKPDPAWNAALEILEAEAEGAAEAENGDSPNTVPAKAAAAVHVAPSVAIKASGSAL